MKIAVPYNHGQVAEDFGTARIFRLYDVENGVVRHAVNVNTEAIMHGALAVLLDERDVTDVISRPLSRGLASALMSNGIKTHETDLENADEAVQAFLAEASV